MDGADVCRTSSRASRRPPDVISTAAILNPRWRRRKWRHPGPGARFSIPVVEGGGKWRPFRFRSPSWVTSFAGTGNEVTQDGDRKRKGRHFPPPSTMGIEKRALYYSWCSLLHKITGKYQVTTEHHTFGSPTDSAHILKNMMTTYESLWYQHITRSVENKFRTYSSKFRLEPYIIYTGASKCRDITRLRISCRPLAVETGRCNKPKTHWTKIMWPLWPGPNWKRTSYDFCVPILPWRKKLSIRKSKWTSKLATIFFHLTKILTTVIQTSSTLFVALKMLVSQRKCNLWVSNKIMILEKMII